MKNTINSVKKIEWFHGFGNLFCIDQSLKELNATGTFKDKQPQALKVILEGEKFGERPITIGAMSTGNTAYSVLKFALDYNKANKQKITPVIFVPLGFENRPYFGPDSSGKTISGKEYFNVLKNMADLTGGRIISLNFGTPGSKSNKDYLSSLRLAKVAKEQGLIEEKGLFLNITEGLETTTFLDAEQISKLSEEEYLKLPKLGIKAYQPIIVKGLEDLKREFGKTPDYIICQFGAGILFNEVKDYIKKIGLKTKVIPVAVGDPESCAEKIYPSYWTENPSKLRYGGTTKSRHDDTIVYGVEDWEIGEALEELRDLNAEASGVAGFAILHRLKDICSGLDIRNDVVLTINTGNGIPNFCGGQNEL